MQNGIVAKYTLIEACKRSLVYLYPAAVMLSIALGGYVAGLAISDRQAVLAGFYGFFIRLAAAAITGGYVILTEIRALERDNITLWLALPIGRLRYTLEKTLAYAGLAAVVALAVTAPLPVLGVPVAAAVMWGLSLLLELLVVVILALLLSFVFRHPLTALAAFAAVYLFARSAAGFYRHAAGIIAGPSGPVETALAWVLKLTTYLVPRLEHFAAAGWLMYPGEQEPRWMAILPQAGLYSALLLALALERMRQRQF